MEYKSSRPRIFSLNLQQIPRDSETRKKFMSMWRNLSPQEQKNMLKSLAEEIRKNRSENESE